jgi:MFS family permease
MTLLGVSVSQMLVINGVTFLFVVAGIAAVAVPEARHATEQGWRALTAGARIARSRPTLWRLLATMTAFSLLALPFVGLFPTMAARGLHLNPTTATYSWLFSVFGLGTLIGGLSVASVFARLDRRRLIPPGFAGFGVCMALFALCRSAAWAFPVVFVLGVFYFMVATAMNTEFQGRLENSERVLVMALWFMSFGGMVPVGNLIFGPVVDRIGAHWVLGLAAVVGLVLAWWCNLPRLEAQGRLESASATSS